MNNTQIIMFNIKAGVRLIDQNAILKKISQMPGVLKAARLVPEQQDDNLSNICYIELENTENLHMTQERLNVIEELEDVSIPVVRGLSTE